MGDDDKLCVGVLFDIGGETVDVDIVKRRFDLVENVERSRIDFENGKI